MVNSEEAYGVFEDAEGKHSYTRQQISDMPRKDKIQIMIDWFHAYYEDPAVRTPYESREGGYQWIWGGPYDANEELQDEFSDVVDLEIIAEAVDLIQGDGFEWAPKEQPGDYEGDELGVDAGEVADGDGEWPPVVAEFRQDIDEPSAKKKLIERLERLETLVQPLTLQFQSIGHNNPPSPIDENIVSRQEWVEVIDAIYIIRSETAAPSPNILSANRQISRFRAIASKIAKWLAERATKGIDATIKAAATTIGAAGGIKALSNADEIFEALNQAINAGTAWVSSLPLPF